MSAKCPVLLRRIRTLVLVPLLLPVLDAILFQPTAAEQWLDHNPDTSGYVTAVHSPTTFDVDGRPVITSSDTQYGLIGDKNPTVNNPLRSAIRVGVYVRVIWPYDDSKKTTSATTVLIREDWDKQLSGVGLIDKVIATGAEPVLEADGYRIRITQATQVSFHGKLKMLADVDTNTLMRFEGKRDKTGILVADQAEFTPVDPKKLEPIQRHVGQVPVPNGGAILDMDGKLKSTHTKVRYEQSKSLCGWFRVPGDPALQARVQRIGERLVPDYQKQLAIDHPSKIDFRFYAVDAPDFRTDLFCTPGLIMVPKQMVERLKNEDQLAAVLAEGIALNLQWQVVKQTENADAAEFWKAAADIYVVYDPLGFVIADKLIAPAVLHSAAVRWREEQLRIALSLMADAGYDPWQAPEAWRLLAPKKLPKDMDLLSYPSWSGYQLGILNLQYRTSGAAAGN